MSQEAILLIRNCSKVQQWAWDELGLKPEDGMLVTYAGKPVWIPVSEQELLATIEADPDPQMQAYAAAYRQGDYQLCRSIHQKQLKQSWNYDKEASRKRSTAASHRRRARKAKAFGSHSDAEWTAVLKKYRYRCALCKIKAKLEKDHIIPLCAGGSNLAVNLQPLCKSCNSAKSGRIQIGAQFGIFDQVNIRETQGQIIKKVSP